MGVPIKLPWPSAPHDAFVMAFAQLFWLSRLLLALRRL
jgi:hypothetical protein